MRIRAHERGFGARITGLDLCRLTDSDVAEIRAAWLEHQVVCFPDQPMRHEDLARFSLAMGPFRDDPYIAAIDANEHIIEIRREPDETVSPFGSAWHSDWSFQKTPPAATILHAKIVPPVGGDTLSADSYAAFEALSQMEQSELEALWINSVYAIGIKGMSDAESLPLLERLNAFSTEARFVYRHHWSENVLTMWDNRSVQHTAEGGYDGHRRVMHGTTVVGDSPYLAAD
jgi:taurine dioxygenase